MGQIKGIPLTRTDTTSNWEQSNRILKLGEIGFDKEKNIFKIGDGVTGWNSLKSHYSRTRKLTLNEYNSMGDKTDDDMYIVTSNDKSYIIDISFGNLSMKDYINNNSAVQIYDDYYGDLIKNYNIRMYEFNYRNSKTVNGTALQAIKFSYLKPGYYYIYTSDPINIFGFKINDKVYKYTSTGSFDPAAGSKINEYSMSELTATYSSKSVDGVSFTYRKQTKTRTLSGKYYYKIRLMDNNWDDENELTIYCMSANSSYTRNIYISTEIPAHGTFNGIKSNTTFYQIYDDYDSYEYAVGALKSSGDVIISAGSISDTISNTVRGTVYMYADKYKLADSMTEQIMSIERNTKESDNSGSSYVIYASNVHSKFGKITVDTSLAVSDVLYAYSGDKSLIIGDNNQIQIYPEERLITSTHIDGNSSRLPEQNYGDTPSIKYSLDDNSVSYKDNSVSDVYSTLRIQLPNITKTVDSYNNFSLTSSSSSTAKTGTRTVNNYGVFKINSDSMEFLTISSVDGVQIKGRASGDYPSFIKLGTNGSISISGYVQFQNTSYVHPNIEIEKIDYLNSKSLQNHLIDMIYNGEVKQIGGIDDIFCKVIEGEEVVLGGLNNQGYTTVVNDLRGRYDEYEIDDGDSRWSINITGRASFKSCYVNNNQVYDDSRVITQNTAPTTGATLSNKNVIAVYE